MTYIKKAWVTGEKIKQNPLNNMEEGIHQNSVAIDTLIKAFDTADKDFAELEGKVTENTQNISALEAKITGNTENITANTQAIADNSQSIASTSNSLGSLQSANTAQIDSLNARINDLTEQISDLKKTNIVEINPSSPDVNLNQPEADLVVTVDTPITTATTVVGKSVTLQNVETEDAPVTVQATGDVTLKGFSNSGNLPKATSNAAVKIKSDDYVVITGATLAQTGYNSIEIGLGTTDYNPAAKNILIDSCDFSASLSNNAISIFSQQENAVITISNCHFASVSNCIRISNRTNTHATYNFINCTCDNWDTSEYAGFLLLQDYTAKTAEQAQADNRFAKLKLNFVNLVGPNGKILPTAVADVCPGGSDDQVLYAYNGKEGILPYSTDRYPEVTFA